MKIKSLFILLFASLWITNCTQPPKDVTNEIVKANQDFLELFNAHNGEAVGKLYTENGRLMPANSPVIVGQEAIGNFWNAVAGMGIDHAELSTVHVESFGDTAVEEGAYKLFDANNNQLDEGKYIIVWKNIEGHWRIDRDIFSSNIPPPPPAKEEEPATEDNKEE